MTKKMSRKYFFYCYFNEYALMILKCVRATTFAALLTRRSIYMPFLLADVTWNFYVTGLRENTLGLFDEPFWLL